MAENEKNIVTEEVTKTPEPSIDLNAEIARLKAENEKLKVATDKACSEAAGYKKSLREKQTEQERAEADRAEKDAAIQAELAQYRTQNRISNYKDQLMACGYDLETATAMASSLPEGVSDDFFASQKQFLDNQTKVIEGKLLGNQPSLSMGKTPTAKDIEDAQTNDLRRWAGLI